MCTSREKYTTSAFLGLVGGVAAWVASTYFAGREDQRNQAIFLHQVDVDKLKVVEFIDEKKIDIASALLDYYSEKYKDEKQYLVLLDALQAYLDTFQEKLAVAPPPQTKLEASSTALSLTPEFIQEQFYSSSRRSFAERLVDSFEKSDPAGQQALVASLLSAIILDKGDAHRYRVNLYIALTFSMLPKVRGEIAPKVSEALNALEKSSKEVTFQKNIRNALARQAG